VRGSPLLTPVKPEDRGEGKREQQEQLDERKPISPGSKYAA
jgi:hypothetical protein